MYWAKFEIWQITQKRDGAVYKTKPLGFRWFKHGEFPETYVEFRDEQGRECVYCNTTDMHFGKDKPKEGSIS